MNNILLLEGNEKADGLAKEAADVDGGQNVGGQSSAASTQQFLERAVASDGW